MVTVLLRPEDLDADSVELGGATYRHLFRARRLPAGVKIRAVDGRGRARWAEVERVERQRAVLKLSTPAPSHEPSYHLYLWVAVLRPERASWLVEKATEIGVRAIRFIAAERTPRKMKPAGLERLQRVARSAVEQSHRSWMPEITGVDPWETVVASLKEGGDEVDRYVLDTGLHEEHEFSSNRQSTADSSEIALQSRGEVLVGPEGGWSDLERRQLEELGLRVVSLGGRTLRVETAAIAAAVKLLC